MRKLDVHMARTTVDNEKVIVCTRCDAVICPAEENYKRYTLCERSPLTEAGPVVNDPSEFVDEEMEFRRFYCPDCGTLLETEVILSALSPVHDKELKE